MHGEGATGVGHVTLAGATRTRKARPGQQAGTTGTIRRSRRRHGWDGDRPLLVPQGKGIPRRKESQDERNPETKGIPGRKEGMPSSPTRRRQLSRVWEASA